MATQTTAKDETAAYEFFVESLARRLGESKAHVEAETSYSTFQTNFQEVYQQYLEGDYSLGRMAEKMGLSTFQLDELLHLLGLT